MRAIISYLALFERLFLISLTLLISFPAPRDSAEFFFLPFPADESAAFPSSVCRDCILPLSFSSLARHRMPVVFVSCPGLYLASFVCPLLEATSPSFSSAKVQLFSDICKFMWDFLENCLWVLFDFLSGEGIGLIAVLNEELGATDNFGGGIFSRWNII